ncbi:MAG TPA: dethiobiotin synthase [Steroidobacteraceae bacterium]|jgi:dethiobiotin synthetase|nr:dethiobiotin synthase [Steroidobacteraceae bacterium]
MNLSGYFIAGTDTGVGKTRVTVGLLAALAQAGVYALGMKAVASGTEPSGHNEDVALIQAANERALAAGATGPALDANPYCFQWPISPHLAAHRAGVTIDPLHIAAAARKLVARPAQAGQDALLLVEGTGGWLAPIGPGRTMADVAAALGLPVVLVVGLRLGCLNHALLSARAITGSALPLAGWIGSHIEPQMLALDENIATLDEWLPAPRLGLLAHSASPLADGAQLAAAARLLHDDALR